MSSPPGKRLAQLDVMPSIRQRTYHLCEIQRISDPQIMAKSHYLFADHNEWCIGRAKSDSELFDRYGTFIFLTV